MTTSWLRDLNLKPRSSSVKTFKSYVDLDAGDVQGGGVAQDDNYEKVELDQLPIPCTTPTLLPGEVIIAEAENVLKFNTRFELNKGISGVLICTNFKLTFVTAENLPSNLHQRNLLLGENDICLTNIDSIYNASGGKHKRISSCPSGNIEVLEVHCKNFRIYTFSFKFSPTNQRAILSSILHHAFPVKLHLLFAFDYCEAASYAEKNAFHSFNFTRANDWELEMHRCHCPGWRITHANEKFLLCDSLPECFVVPSILMDTYLNQAAPHFSGHRVPTWSWGLPSGASVVRMAAKDPGISDHKEQENLIDIISRTNIGLQQVKIFNLDELCPSVKDIQNSYLKLKDLCMPLTSDDFWSSDSGYLTKLDATKWLQVVSSCLRIGIEAALAVQSDTTVVFVEGEGRDLNCVLSSLVQIFLDPFYHKQNGFQNLIQKEWVALGHPFTERLHHISGNENEESPIFLVFLDCVWQLMQQCPTVFEFSETYLTTLWDSCHQSLFDTFLFSCHKSRTDALSSQTNKFQLRSVWNWTKQFSRQDIKLFSNPLYILNRYRKGCDAGSQSPISSRPKSFNSVKEARHSQRRPLTISKDLIQPLEWDEKEECLLLIDPHLTSISLWHQCYLRWVPMANIIGGGPPVVFLNNLKLADDINISEKILHSLSTRTKHPKPPTLHRRIASDDYTISADSIDFSQIHDESCVVTSAFPFFPVAPYEWHSFDFVPSMSCLQISYTSDDDLDD